MLDPVSPLENNDVDTLVFVQSDTARRLLTGKKPHAKGCEGVAFAIEAHLALTVLSY